MQTIHALLLQVDNGNVTLQRELMLTAARTASALIVRRDGPNEIRLGIGEPAARMLSERDWLLVFGPDSDQRLDIGADPKAGLCDGSEARGRYALRASVPKRPVPGAGRLVFGERERFCARWPAADNYCDGPTGVPFAHAHFF